MTNFDKPRTTIDFDEREEAHNFTYLNSWSLVKGEGANASDDSDYDSDYYQHVRTEKRFAKDPRELRKDIIKMFDEKPKWTWEEVKKRMSDQPEAPLKKSLLEQCDKVWGTGNGNTAEFVLKKTFKM